LQYWIEGFRAWTILIKLAETYFFHKGILVEMTIDHLEIKFAAMSNSPLLALALSCLILLTRLDQWKVSSVGPTFMTFWAYERDASKVHAALNGILASASLTFFGLHVCISFWPVHIVGIAPPFFLWTNYAGHLADPRTGYKMLRLLQLHLSRFIRLQLYPDRKRTI
jgi:hypothetical protein